MAVSLDVRELLVASWEIGEKEARGLLPGLEPSAVDGRHLVSIVSLGRVRARVGKVPLIPFSQVNLRAYALLERQPAVLFLRSWVTVPGMVVALAGGPVGVARIRFRPGLVEAPGAGIRIRYELGGPAESGQLGRHELGLHRRGHLRAFTVKRGLADWREAKPLEVRADPLLSLGLDVSAPPELLYAPEATFRIDRRPQRIHSQR